MSERHPDESPTSPNRLPAVGVVDAGRSESASGAGRFSGAGWRGWLTRDRAMSVAAVLGVLVPLALLLPYATTRPPSFDGAMNLDVAQNVSNGLGYVRRYGQTQLFPEVIQTSGLFIFLAAGLIALFGPSTFVFALPNLLFLVVLLVAVSIALKRWPLLRVLGPSIVLFAVPGMLENGLLGYGEYVIAAMVFLAFVLVARTATGGARPMLAIGAAAALIGASWTVKAVAVLAIPVLLIGVVVACLVRPDLNRKRVAASLLFVFAPIVPVELHRLFSFGSFSEYFAYWGHQFQKIAAQAGVGSDPTVAVDPEVGGVFTKIGNHVGVLAGASGMASWFVIVLLVAPFATLLTLFLTRRESWRDWFARPQALLALMLATYAGGYLVWWLAISPTSKAWLRRVAIALLALALLYLLLAGMLKDRLSRMTAQVPERADVASRSDIASRTAAGGVAAGGVPASRPAAGRVAASPAAESGPAASRPTAVGPRMWGWRIAAILVVLVPVIAAANIGWKQVRTVLTADDVAGEQVAELAAAADALVADGAAIYGIGWWAAPQVALYGDIPIGNLQHTDICDPASKIVSGQGYIVWDYYAKRLFRPEPIGKGVTFSEIPDGASPRGVIWKITVKPGVC